MNAHPYDHIPETMTVNAGFEVRVYQSQDVIRGRPLSRRFVRWLEASTAGQARQQRLEQMREINAPVAHTYGLRQRGQSVQEIAERTGISVSAVYDRLRRADEFMRGTLAPANDEERLRNLEIRDPLAHTVVVLRHFGWSHDDVATKLDRSPSTVKRAAARADTALGGGFRGRTLDRYADIPMAALLANATESAKNDT